MQVPIFNLTPKVLDSLKCAVKIHIPFQYTEVQNQSTISCVTNELIPRVLPSTCAHAKPLAPVAVAKDIIKFLFASDEQKYLHTRIHNQVTFAIHSMLVVNVRPGEVIESDAWYQTNEGLLQNTIELVCS